ncbi:hypothetical protein SRABI76_02481 [Microbacterium oxydans]|nr:hypothetical protein SRABI76_02481 [Microbacterium oxydans]
MLPLDPFDGHVPGVDHVDRPGPLVEHDVAEPRPVEPEVPDAHLPGDAAPWHVPVTGQRLPHAFRRLGEQLFEEPDAVGRCAVQLAALRPPQDLVVAPERGRQVGLSMPDVAAADGALPEPPHHLLAGDVAPPLIDVALVRALVDHDRLAPALAPVVGVLRGAIHVDALDADVRDPGRGVVVERTAVVDRVEVPEGILLADDGREPFPVRRVLRPEQVVLVRHRPPHVREARQPAHHVAQVALIDGRTEVCEAPAVVGVEQDEVGLDAETGQLHDPLLQPAEVLGIEALEIEAIGQRTGEREVRRLVGVVQVRLREHAHAELRERRLGERREGLLLQLVGLMRPRVRSRAERTMTGAVRMPEMEALDPHRSVRPLGRRGDRDGAGDAVE